VKGGQAASGVWMDCILCYAGDMKYAMRDDSISGSCCCCHPGIDIRILIVRSFRSRLGSFRIVVFNWLGYSFLMTR
jgi:hypothetical protein